MRYSYPIQLDPEPDGSAVNLSFPDVPGALTFGEDEAEALAMAEDCLIAALRGYMKLGKAIAAPSARARSSVRRPALARSGKARALCGDARGADQQCRAGTTFGVTENVVRKLLDLDHRSHIGQVEAALGKLGVRLEVVARKAA